jgi:4-hydroxy-L-threonine phosphate dehydrogenase PdxA
VLGLNPHCGDGGVIGTEEDVLLKPTIKKYSKRDASDFGVNEKSKKTNRQLSCQKK